MSHKPSIQDLAAWISSTDRLVQRSGVVSSAVIRRRFDFSTDRVWNAFTDRERLGKWFGRVKGELREGETVTTDVGAPHLITSRILCCEPPALLIVTWHYGSFP